MRIAAAAFLITASFSNLALAQSNLDRTYRVTAKPAVQIDVDEASVTVRGCGSCTTVTVHVNPNGADMSRWHITDMQGGNGIHYSLKQSDTRSFFGGWHGRSPEVVVSTPGESDLTLRSGDGSISLSGIRGNLDAHTGDGSINANDVAGLLRLTTGDGSIQVHDAEGALTASTGDGSMTMDGRFSQFDAHSGNGSVQLALQPGSALAASSSVTTGDGSVRVQLPRDLTANLDARSGDGSVSSNLPLMSNTSSNDRHAVRGALNGGGPTLQVRSGDGSIQISGR